MCTRERRGRRASRGVALLEALIALLVLGTAGAVVSALVIESGSAVERARHAEAELRRANGFFALVTLWPRADLDRHLGERGQGPWRLRVERVSPSLYALTLSDSTGVRALLHTVVYRPPPHAEP